MSDVETVSVYDEKAADYAQMVERSEPDPALVAFIARVNPGGRVLDLGCGVGNASAKMRESGFTVDAVDASASMVKLANETHQIGAVQKIFDDLDAMDEYDGIWANFSLLHAPKTKIEGHLEQIRTALKSGGIFHIGMKLGEGEMRDSIGRLYSYYSFEELESVLEVSGFSVLEYMLGEGAGLSGEISPWTTIISRSNR